jgi:hypothetical protein
MFLGRSWRSKTRGELILLTVFFQAYNFITHANLIIMQELAMATKFQATNTFLNWFKMITYLSYAPSFAVLTDTLAMAAPEIMGFSFIFFVVVYITAASSSVTSARTACRCNVLVTAIPACADLLRFRAGSCYGTAVQAGGLPLAGER